MPAPVLLLALLIFDLVTLVPRYNSFVSTDGILPSTPAIDWLKSYAGYARVMGVDSPGPVLNPNTQSLFGLYSVAGYDSLHPRRLEEYWGSVDPSVSGVKRGSPYSNVFVRPQAYTSTLAALMNVKYILANNSFVPDAALKLVYKGEISVYENSSALPRAFLVEASERLASADLLARLSAPRFDPLRAVLIEEEPPTNRPQPDQSTQTSVPGRVVITSYRRNSVYLDVDLERAAWLVLADPNYPGWTVTVDGLSEKVYTAYYQFRAVPLESGRHRVAFSFIPTNFLAAGMISITTLVMILALLAAGLIRIATGRSRKSLRGDEGCVP